MSYKLRSILLWAAAIVFTLILVVYQRMTGPTYPVRGEVTIAGNEIGYRLARSNESDKDALVEIKTGDPEISGVVKYKRFKTPDDWTVLQMVNDREYLKAALPKQPPAGKLIYTVELFKGAEKIQLSEEPVVIRFKGSVPAFVLIPHILLMFTAMLFSTRTGLESLFSGRQTMIYTLTTLVTLLTGGLILGPIVQKFAFGDFWTGWPFGSDMTDNKTLVSFIFWAIAAFRLRKNPDNKVWVLTAAIVLIFVYLVPHSMFGSELDYSSGEIQTGK